MNIRNTLFSSVIAVPLLLGGCSQTGTIDLAAFISQVQQAVTTACGAAKIIIPTAKTIADLLAGGDPVVKTVEGMVDLIVATICPSTPAGQAALRKGVGLPRNVSIEIIKIPGQ